MIERQKIRYGWEFIFLGARIDAVETAGRFGISADRAQNYHADSGALNSIPCDERGGRHIPRMLCNAGRLERRDSK